MPRKRILCLLLCLTMLVGILAGCAEQQTPDSESSMPPEQSPAENEDISDTTPLPTSPGSYELSEELLAMSQDNPAVTGSDHPQWNGFVLSWDFHNGDFASVDAIEQIAGWGFNYVRIWLDYRNLFEEDVSIIKEDGMKALDSFVSTAIRRGIHLDICLSYLPGRELTANTEYDYSGTFDLFINPQQQERADQVWRTLAERYKGVSNYNLSFTPFAEAMNKNLSTGQPYTDYTIEDVGNYLLRVANVIEAVSPDRLIIYEPTPANDWETILAEATPVTELVGDRENFMISYNFCENPFVYNHMTAEEGQHIDNNNHSLELPQYPTKLYAANKDIDDGGNSLSVTGLLPAGTVVDLYVSDSHDCTLCVEADGALLYQETMPTQTFATGTPLSCYHLFTTSEKKISVTLEKDTELLRFYIPNGGMAWCGLELTLPEEYATERLMYATDYDVSLGLQSEAGIYRYTSSSVRVGSMYLPECTQVTIADDLSFTTQKPWAETTKETIREWCERISKLDGNCIVRFERAAFTAVEWEDMKAYYTDVLDLFQEYGFSWTTNDYWIMTDEYPQTKVVANSPSEAYDGFDHFNKELLELYQSYIP